MRKIYLFIIIFLSLYPYVYAQSDDFNILYNQTIKLSDGTILYHDLYVPKGKSNFPSILIRTPYDKSGMVLFASHFAKNGFAVLLQDVRGKNESKGAFIPFINEKKDGKETLDWLSRQSWCNGNIGLWGSSYLGYCALSIADFNHPALKSIFNLSGWIDGTKINTPGGAFHQMLIIPWLLSDGQTSIVSEKGADLDEMFAHTPLKEAIPGGGLTYTLDDGSIITLLDFTTDFLYQDVTIPIFHINGWNDFTVQSALDTYLRIKEKSNAKQYLVLGPWYHNQIYDDYDIIGDYKLPEIGKFNIDMFLFLATEWFHHTLEKKSFDFDSKKRVKYYILFLNQWKYAEQWPPKNNLVSFYLQKKELLSVSASRDLDSKNSFIYNPNTPTPTLGGANFHLFTDKVGIKNQETIESRKDVLIYTTPPFKEQKIIAGKVNTELYIETEGRGTDFTAKLTLIDKTGVSRNILDGIIRVDSAHIENNVTKIQIGLGDIAFKINKDERLRLQISSSNYPKFNRNPNTGIDPFEAIKFIPVRQTIHHSKKYPSKITIPFLKD